MAESLGDCVGRDVWKERKASITTQCVYGRPRSNQAGETNKKKKTEYLAIIINHASNNALGYGEGYHAILRNKKLESTPQVNLGNGVRKQSLISITIWFSNVVSLSLGDQA